MTKWLRCIIPCFSTRKQLNTSLSEKESVTILNIKNKINDEEIGVCKTTERNNNRITNYEKENEIVILNEILNNNDYDERKNETYEQQTELDANLSNDSINGINNKNNINNTDKKNDRKLENRTLISCTLHESLNDFCHANVTHTNLKSRLCNRFNKEKPRNTLVFQTVMLDGEPCITRYKTTEPHLIKAKSTEKLNNKLGEEIKGSDIKLVFSHEVLEYLTKSFLHDKDNNLTRDKNNSNDLVVCTLFPKQTLSESEKSISDMDIDASSSEICETKIMINNNYTHDSMDIDESNSNSPANSISLIHNENDMFNETELSPRSEYKLVQTVNIHPSMSKSSPHMPQQSSNNNNNKEIPRLRRNISKKVSWKENVVVCFINHSSKSANEILQEVQPLIDHEVYWRDCVGEMDRKRREKWLKIRAVEQRCLTGDGQFHDYFACRMHNSEEE